MTNPVAPACDSWDQIRPLGALPGPPGPSEDLVGLQRALFGPLWVLKWPQSGPTSHIIMYYTCGDCLGATWTLLGCLGRHGAISPIGACEQIQESQFCNPENFLSNIVAHLFLTLLLTKKGTFCAILTNLKMMFLRKIHFFAYPIWAKNGLFLVPRAPF